MVIAILDLLYLDLCERKMRATTKDSTRCIARRVESCSEGEPRKADGVCKKLVSSASVFSWKRADSSRTLRLARFERFVEIDAAAFLKQR